MILIERKDDSRQCQCCGQRYEGVDIRVAQKAGDETAIALCDRCAMKLTVMLMERNWVKR